LSINLAFDSMPAPSHWYISGKASALSRFERSLRAIGVACLTSWRPDGDLPEINQ
jgi:hypothetical protein